MIYIDIYIPSTPPQRKKKERRRKTKTRNDIYRYREKKKEKTTTIFVSWFFHALIQVVKGQKGFNFCLPLKLDIIPSNQAKNFPGKKRKCDIRNEDRPSS